MCTELRLDRRFISAFSIILPSSSPSSASTLSSRFVSFASSSSYSAPSRPGRHGRFSKYSKPPPKLSWNRKEPEPNHPAFKPLRQLRSPAVPPPDGDDCISLGEKGLAFKLKDAPFEFQYSYTETPKVKPLALREPPFLPFGPKETPRPWTGRAPLPPSKKKIPEFDSFKLPPHGKKGVKPVQAPGPFLAGSGGPKYTASREEILGEPLTQDEVADLIKGCLRATRQLNMGRDGLTHNMLDNIHAHWKRRRVCKIKCRGVCTVDMDNVCQQLEEKTGGKVIHRKGGVVFLFRGRNYNYRTRPRFPLMLWKPITPVYPRLVKRVPDGLTFEEVNELRKRGSKVLPICKLGKNGVYMNLVTEVREAFEACELVRVNCKGMNKSDYKKIGAKLQDLVPCVLLSFEFEHILMWRGKNWKSSLPPSEIDGSESSLPPVEINGSESSVSPVEIDGSDEASSSTVDDLLLVDATLGTAACDNISEKNSQSEPLVDENERCSELRPEISSRANGVITDMPLESFGPCNGIMKEPRCQSDREINADHILTVPCTDSTKLSDKDTSEEVPSSKTIAESSLEEIQETESESKINTKTEAECLAGVRLLLDQAMGSGNAVILSEIECKNSDIVYQQSVELAKTAQPGPTFQVRIRNKGFAQKDKIKKHAPLLHTPLFESLDPPQEMGNEILVLNSERSPDSRINGSNNRRRRKDELLELMPNVVPHGSLGIDELAKLLS